MAKGQFRLDIQGLRAIAVLSVVLFHISPEHLTGGYLGVDVFFVISGYLIMGQIWRAHQRGSFSFQEFYIKRFRRLLPALLTVLFFSTVAAYFFLLPGEFKGYTLSVVSSLFYYSNFWFYTKSGYFDAELQSAPLLHTWSLSVEEQFYFIFPLLLALLYKFTPKAKPAVIVLSIVAVLSLVLSEWLISIDQSLSFYASPTRFWQFIAGGLLSIAPVPQFSARIKDGLAWVSLLFMAALFFYFDETTPFPGIYAIPITLATAVVIYARPEKGLLGFAMTNPVSNYLGNISYSLYLWHWPVITFYKSQFLGDLSKYDKLFILTLSILLASLTYYLVENPLRRNKGKNAFNFIAIIRPLAVSAIVAALVLYLPTQQRTRFDEEQIFYEDFLTHGAMESMRGSCFLTKRFNDFKYFDEAECVRYEADKYNILLLGDSHAAHWQSAMREQAKENVTVTQVTASGCRPLLPLKGAKRCTDLISWSNAELISSKRFDKIILSGRWIKRDVEKIAKTIEFYKQYTDDVVVYGPVVEYEYALPWLLAKFGGHANLEQFSRYELISETDRRFQPEVLKAGGTYQSILNTICLSANTCTYISSQGKPMQFDYGHLTHSGAADLLLKLNF